MAPDQGLQPARTMLAWRRTCLAYAGGSAVAARLLLDHSLVTALVLGLTGIVLSLGAYVAAEVRHRRVLEGQRQGGAFVGGAIHIGLMACAAATVVFGGALYLLVRPIS